MHDQFRSEWGKAWSVPVPALCLAAAVLIAGITTMTLANDVVHAASTGELPPDARVPVTDILGPVASFTQVAVAAFALQLVTSEYVSGQIRPTFLAAPRRRVVVLAKLAVAVLSAALLGAPVGVGTSVLAEWVLGEHAGESLSFGAAALGTAAVFGTAAAVAVGLAWLTRSALGAMSASFVVLVVSLAAPDDVGRWLPGPAGQALITGIGDLTRPESLAVLLAWAFGTLVLSDWTVRHRDA